MGPFQILLHQDCARSSFAAYSPHRGKEHCSLVPVGECGCDCTARALQTCGDMRAAEMCYYVWQDHQSLSVAKSQQGLRSYGFHWHRDDSKHRQAHCPEVMFGTRWQESSRWSRLLHAKFLIIITKMKLPNTISCKELSKPRSLTPWVQKSICLFKDCLLYTSDAADEERLV